MLCTGVRVGQGPGQYGWHGGGQRAARRTAWSTHWEDLGENAPLILDVRDRVEYRLGHVEDAVHIPVDQLRGRLDELPKDREIAAYCFVGIRSYIATRILSQNGYSVKNISGGYKSNLMH